MKAGDLVRYDRFIVGIFSNDPASKGTMTGMIIRELTQYDRPHYQVLWSGSTLLVENELDLEVIDESSG